jgi:type II secretory pathway pseudopilin PulG
MDRNSMRGKTSNIKSSKGFTLVELLTSIIVLVAIGSVVSGVIVSSLRGSNKTNNIESIRQAGNYALSQMSKDIEYAQSFDGKNTGLSNDDGVTYDTSCKLALNPTPTPVTPYSLITVQSSSNIITKYTKYRCTPSELSADENALIASESGTLIGCSLTCIQNNPMDAPIIKISFSIGSKNSNGLVESSNPPIVFETSVTMRNYRK